MAGKLSSSSASNASSEVSRAGLGDQVLSARHLVGLASLVALHIVVERSGAKAFDVMRLFPREWAYASTGAPLNSSITMENITSISCQVTDRICKD